MSLSGPAKLFGAAQRSGIKLAQDEINASQFLGNTRLEVIVEDDASDRDQAAGAFQRFIENSHVLAIIGPTLSDTALSVDPIAQQAGVPVLAISNAATRHHPDRQLHLSRLPERESAHAAGHQGGAPAAEGEKRGAAVQRHRSDPAGLARLQGCAAGDGRPDLAEQSFAASETDFSPQLEEIAATRPDALFVTAPAQSAAAILIQARKHGFEQHARDRRQHVQFGHGPAHRRRRRRGFDRRQRLERRDRHCTQPAIHPGYHASYGVDPDQLAAQAYTGVYIIAAALKSSGSVTDPRALRDALERIRNLDTPLGPFGFTDTRDADYPARVQIVRFGRFQLL